MKGLEETLAVRLEQRFWERLVSSENMQLA